MVYVVAVVRPDGEPRGDALTYHLLARLLAAGRGYVRPLDLIVNGREVASAEFPPVWPALLAGASELGLRSVTAHRLVGAVLGGVTVVLVGLLARTFAGPVAGLAAATVTALHPQLIGLDGALLSEAALLPLTAGVLLVATTAVQQQPAGRRGALLLGALGLLVGLAALTRSEAVLLIPFLAVPAAVLAGPRERPARVARLALVLAPAVVLLGVWTVRNAVRLDAVVPLTTNSSTLLAGANCDEVFHGPRTGQWSLRCATAPLTAPVTDEAQAAAAMRDAGLGYLADHPGRLPSVAGVRALRTWGLWDVPGQLRYESFEGRDLAWLWAGWSAHLGVLVLAIAGAVALRRDRRPRWILLVPIGVVLVTALMAYGNQRFRALAEPSLMVLAGVGIASLIGRRHSSAALASSAISPVSEPVIAERVPL